MDKDYNTANSITKYYKIGGITTLFFYILTPFNDGSDHFRVADKFYPGSDNGDGLPSGTTLAEMQTFITQRIEDHLNDASISSVVPAVTSPVKDLSTITVNFSEPVLGGTASHITGSNFTLTGTGVSSPVITVTPSNSLAESYTLNISATYSTGTATLSAVNIVDTSNRALTGTVSFDYSIDVTPPKVLSVALNPR